MPNGSAANIQMVGAGNQRLFMSDACVKNVCKLGKASGKLPGLCTTHVLGRGRGVYKAGDLYAVYTHAIHLLVHSRIVRFFTVSRSVIPAFHTTNNNALQIKRKD